MSGPEIAGMAAIGGVVIGVLTTHYTSVSSLRSKAAVLDSEISNIKAMEGSCRKEVIERLGCIDKKVGQIRETLARMNGEGHPSGHTES